MRYWLRVQKGDVPTCPTCRAPTNLIYRKNSDRPKAKYAHLNEVKLYFNEDPKSDPASQFLYEGLIEDIDDEEDKSDDDPILDGEGGGGVGGAGGAREAGVLEDMRGQLREMRNTLREVKEQRDDLLNVRQRLFTTEEELQDSKFEVEELGCLNRDLEDEVSRCQTTIEELELGQPDLRLELLNLNEELAVLSRDFVLKEEEIDSVREELSRKEIELTELDNSTREEKIKWVEERKRLLIRVNEGGNAGAEKIRKLKAEVGVQEAKVLE